MDKSTLSNYGWIVIAVLVLAVMIALATPFGTYIENGVKSTTQGLFDTSEKAMNVVGMSAGDGSFENSNLSNGSGETEMPEPQYGTNDPLLNHSGIIPEGGVYYQNGYCGKSCYAYVSDNGSCACGNITNATILKAGDAFPQNISYDSENYIGDCYVYGDYVYITEHIYNSKNGWHVKETVETKENYDKYLESINGEDVINITYTFSYNNILKEIPELSPKIKTAYGAFDGCQNAKFKNNEYIIPANVEDIGYLFNGCKNIEGTIRMQLDSLDGGASECFAGTTKQITLINEGTMPNDFFEFLKSTSTNNNIEIQ